MRDERETVNGDESRAEAAPLSRRAFCRRAALSASAIAAAPALAAGQENVERKIEGAELLMLGYAMTFRYPTDRDLAILVRTRDGRYHAYTQNCTHQGCPVNFGRAHDRLECPCHQGAYDLQTGRNLFGPPRLPLTRINLELRGGEVWAVGKG